MTSRSFNFKKALEVSTLVLALVIPQTSFAANSCKAAVAPDPSRGVHLVIGPADADMIFANARSKFLEMMGNGKDFEKVFELIASGQRPKHPGQTLDELKDFRKLGIRLRSEFVVLGDDHVVPEAFEEFMKKLGHLNDALEFRVWKKAAKEAKKTLKTYRRAKLIAALDSFKAAPPDSIVSEVSNLKVDTLALLEKPHSTVTEFHDTRKDLKHLLSLVQAFNERTPTAEFKNAFDFLVLTNDTLGDMRQDVLEAELKSGKGDDHDDDTQDLPKDVKESVKTFLSKLRVDLAA